MNTPAAWTLTFRPTATLLPATVRLRQLLAQARALGLEAVEVRPLGDDLQALAPVTLEGHGAIVTTGSSTTAGSRRGGL